MITHHECILLPRSNLPHWGSSGHRTPFRILQAVDDGCISTINRKCRICVDREQYIRRAKGRKEAKRGVAADGSGREKISRKAENRNTSLRPNSPLHLERIPPALCVTSEIAGASRWPASLHASLFPSPPPSSFLYCYNICRLEISFVHVFCIGIGRILKSRNIVS